MNFEVFEYNFFLWARASIRIRYGRGTINNKNFFELLIDLIIIKIIINKLIEGTIHHLVTSQLTFK